MKESESIEAYHTSYLQGLKKKLIASIDNTTDEDKLEQCLELLHADSMPCCFTDEEFAEELRLSEASGYVTMEETLKKFAKWGFER